MGHRGKGLFRDLDRGGRWAWALVFELFSLESYLGIWNGWAL